MQIDTDRSGFTEDLAIYDGRRKKLAALLREKNIDALLVSQAANRFYLSGFELHDGQPNETSGFLIITTNNEDWLATDSRYEEAAAKIWPRDRLLIYKSNTPKTLGQLLSKTGASIGIDSQGVSLSFFQKLKAYSKAAFVSGDGLVEKLRMIKSPEEIAALKSSFALNHQLLEWLEKNLGKGSFTGFTEKDVAWEIEKYFRENGAQELAFPVITAAGKNGALPHAIPGSETLKKGAPLLVDIGCRVNNYCSDQTRTFWIGEEPAHEFLKTLGLVRDAQEAAISFMRPGITCAKVYEAAWKVFEKAGVEKAFTHGLGHGVGLETHEAPSLSPTSCQTLQAGMAVTVEPGLYYPEWGGIRWEYTVLVEADGVKVL